MSGSETLVTPDNLKRYRFILIVAIVGMALIWIKVTELTNQRAFWVLLSAFGVGLFFLASADFINAAVQSQPACVEHTDWEDTPPSGFRAAKSSCSPD